MGPPFHAMPASDLWIRCPKTGLSLHSEEEEEEEEEEERALVIATGTPTSTPQYEAPPAVGGGAFVPGNHTRVTTTCSSQ